MKKFITTTVAAAAYLTFALPAFAQSPTVSVQLCPSGQFSALCKLSNSSLPSIFSGVITIMLIAAVLISLFFLIWGGIKWILSGGDTKGVEAARNHIIAAIVGLIIAFAAFFILNIVVTLFIGGGLQNLTLPVLGN